MHQKQTNNELNIRDNQGSAGGQGTRQTVPLDDDKPNHGSAGGQGTRQTVPLYDNKPNHGSAGGEGTSQTVPLYDNKPNHGSAGGEGTSQTVPLDDKEALALAIKDLTTATNTLTMTMALAIKDQTLATNALTMTVQKFSLDVRQMKEMTEIDTQTKRQLIRSLDMLARDLNNYNNTRGGGAQGIARNLLNRIDPQMLLELLRILRHQ
ncbi:hypothetical protein niasHT_009022 [Heterodera trifolii]|uniref:Uncharacterized protein n=1 Tax=Heterodera trifolii TaxID=157864 RepID=A0ABD2M204_9BILA